jgi:hypothetical protein
MAHELQCTCQMELFWVVPSLNLAILLSVSLQYRDRFISVYMHVDEQRWCIACHCAFNEVSREQQLCQQHSKQADVMGASSELPLLSSVKTILTLTSPFDSYFNICLSLLLNLDPSFVRVSLPFWASLIFQRRPPRLPEAGLAKYCWAAPASETQSRSFEY